MGFELVWETLGLKVIKQLENYALNLDILCFGEERKEI